MLILVLSLGAYILTQHVLPYAILQPQRVESENYLITKTSTL